MSISRYIQNIRSKIGNELLLMPGVAAVILNERDELLLQLRSDNGEWGLPSGTAEPGEAPAKTLVREVWEETGLRVEPVRILALLGGEKFRHTYPNGDKGEGHTAVFLCRVTGGILRSIDGEAQVLRYFSKDELPLRKDQFPLEILFEKESAAAYFEWRRDWLDDLK